jgi:hypothetical protein
MKRPVAELYSEKSNDNLQEAEQKLECFAPGYLDAERAGNGLALGYDMRGLQIDDESIKSPNRHFEIPLGAL